MQIKHRLRTTLIITLVLTAIIPMLVAGGLAYYYLSDNTTSTIKVNNQLLASAFVEDVRATLKEPQVVLRQVSYFLASHSHSGGQTQNTLDIAVRGTDFFESIYLVDRNGVILGVGVANDIAGSRQDLIGLDYSGNQLFKDAIKAENYPIFSDIFLSLSSGRISLSLCLPMEDKFLIGNFSIEHLYKLTSAKSIGEKLTVSVFDHRGTLIFHPNRLLVDQKVNFSGIAPVQAGLAGREGTYPYCLNGVDYLGSVAIVKDIGWLVCVSQPFTEAYGPISRLRSYFLVIGLVAIVMALAVAMFIGRRFAEPITRLEASARAIAAGDYDFPVSDLKYKELEDLAADFREMAGAVRKRQGLLSESYARVQGQLRFQQSMMDTITMPIFYVDRDGSCLGCNCAFEEATGRDREEWLGKNIAAESGFGLADCFVRHQGFVGGFSSVNDPQLDDYMSFADDGLQTSECTVRYADGASHHLIYYSKPFMDDQGEEGGLVCVCLDITARKDAEKALRQSEERLKLAMDATELGIWTLDVQSDKGYVDERWANMLGYDRDDIVASQEGWTQLVHPDDRDRMAVALKEHMQGRRDYYECEMRLRTKSGGWKWILDRGKITELDKFGKPLRMAGTHKDITEIKKMAEDLRQAQKMEAMGTLAGGIAHDFNNMLNAIIGYTELSQLDLPAGSPVMGNLAEVLIAARRAAELVKQILTFSRQGEQEKQIVKLQPVIKEIIKLLRSSLPSTLEIKADVRADCPPILADITQIHQIVMNLATNASHAMRNRGGELEITLSSEDISGELLVEMSDLSPGRYVVLRVRDSGEGMEPGVMARIFDPYYTTKGLGEGTGLGLATVHGIVRSHGGGIRVDSTLGLGSVFTIYFPAQEEQVVEKEEIPQEKGKGGSLGARIMVVDDEQSLVDFSRRALEKFGCRVSAFTKSTEALAAFTENPQDFDLVLTDQTMPHLTGINMCKEMLKIRADLPVILATGYSEAVDEDNALACGVKRFLMKPLSMDTLIKTVQEFMVVKPNP